MNIALIIFPHQLFAEHPQLDKDIPVYLVEEYLFFSQYKFHKQKLAYHRATMCCFADKLRENGHTVHYIDAQDETSDIRKLIAHLAQNGLEVLHYMDPTDNWLSKHISESIEKTGVKTLVVENKLFINAKEDLKGFFRSDKKKFFQTKFYIDQRKNLGLLLDGSGGALGGKWSYDADNRKKYPKGKTPPHIAFPTSNAYHTEAKKYVLKNYAKNPGNLDLFPIYPTDHSTASAWLDTFLEERFAEFGPYEDAIIKEESFLNHAILTPMLNVGLLEPRQIVDRAISYGLEYDIPLNSLEGFVRQIIGWREFIRGVYGAVGTKERTRNYWGFTRKIPASFYDGTTGIPPIDSAIKKNLNTGYNHHIERLMVLGNFMLLCEFDPDEVYRWFMEMYIDSYDWVMVPNVYGMSQFADGGLMSTKPYISGSNYLMKMSNYQKGPWQATWDGLFWRFMHIQRDFFLSNPRLGMLVRTFDKMSAEKRNMHLENGDAYIGSL